MSKIFYKEENAEVSVFHFCGIKIKFGKHYLPQAVEKSNVKISVVINTYNADRLLEKALQSVLKADEIVICDMHSTDKTIEIAEKYGCKIVYHEKLPQPDPARNFAISKATGDWILILDADEIIPVELWDYLVAYANNPITEKLAINIPRKNWFFDGFLTSNGEDYQLRFFKSGHAKYDEGFVHVPPKAINTDVFLLKNKRNEDLYIHHYAYFGFSKFIEKTNIYTTEELKKHYDKTKIRKSVIPIILIFVEQFFRYLQNKGFKDGFKGFIWYLYFAIYKIDIYIKQVEEKEGLLK